MIFSELVADLQTGLKKDLAQIRFLLKKNPAMAYTRIVEIGKEVGKTYNIKLIVNFPKQGKIEEFEMYGKRDLSLIIDYDRKRFPIDREIIKQKALEMLGETDENKIKIIEELTKTVAESIVSAPIKKATEALD